MGLITQKPNYAIAGGNTTFSAVQLQEDTAAIQVQYSGINSSDAVIYLDQSLDGQNFNEVPGSSKVIDQTKPSHLLNLTIKKGIFVRIGIKVGTATAGTIDVINYLT